MKLKKMFQSILNSEENYRDLIFTLISGLVIGEFALASTHFNVLKAAPIEWWIAMPFATVMLARTITLYGVAKWIRRWFVHMEPDSCHAGENSEPNKGKIEPLGWMIQCPICTGMHSASLLVLIYAFMPEFGWTMAVMLAIAAGSMLLHHIAECLSWSGRLFRVLSGLISPDPETEGYKVRKALYQRIIQTGKEPVAVVHSNGNGNGHKVPMPTVAKEHAPIFDIADSSNRE